MKRARERGWALISVLWVTAMLAMMAAAAQELTLTSVRAERRALARAHLDSDLDAGIVRALLALDDSRAANRWRVDGTPYAFSYDGIDMTISVQDEDGKFDLNEADDDTLQPLFESVGLDSRSASAITDRIVEWRTELTSSDTHTLNGGTDQDYAAAGRPWHPRHGDFQTVSELNLVLGMTPALFEKVRSALTVYSRNDSPDPNVAPRLVLTALNPGNPGQVDKIMSQRAGGFSGVGLSTTQNNSSAATVAPGSDLSGRAFEIDVDARYAGHHSTRRVVLVMTGDTSRPYLVESWE
ncbi:MAG TPA: hypothetical protein VGI20_06465 [Rhizomicrobium sp.]|jgi:general secretion pathway protein K